MKEAIQLLKNAQAEIRSLRKHNELMSARLNMFDDLMLVFNTEPRRYGQGMTEDINWQIDKFIERATAEEMREKV